MPYTVGQFALGLEGLALLRAGPVASEEALASRVTELTALARTLDDPSLAAEAVGTRMDVLSGYARWASVYDQPNPLVMVEGPAAHQAFATWPQESRVLDVACGTGRHTSYLHELGHDVIGIDVSPEMVRIAREKVPGVRFVEGPLDPLPFETGEFDAAVSALALSHIADIAAPIAELARVVRPGGHLVITDFHPFMVLLGGQAAFRTAAGVAHYVPSYVHLPGQMLEVLTRAGLTPLTCAEPTWTREAAQLAFPGMSARFYEEAIAGLPLAIVWQLSGTRTGDPQP